MIFAAQILSLRLDTTDNLCIAQLCFELIECKGLFTKKNCYDCNNPIEHHAGFGK